MKEALDKRAPPDIRLAVKESGSCCGESPTKQHAVMA